MNATFKGLGMKEWTINDNEISFKGEVMKIEDITSFSLVSTPSTALTNGVIQAGYNGKILTLSFSFKQKEAAHSAIEYVKRKIDESKGVVKDYKYLLTSPRGTKWEIYNDYVMMYFLPSNSILGNVFRGGNTGGKKISYKDIVSIQFMEPAGMSAGFMQLSYAGSLESKVGVLGAVNDENSILIDYNTLEMAKSVYSFIEQRRNEIQNKGNNISSLSVADELKKFKELLDMGIITQEEFDKKKKDLLGF